MRVTIALRVFVLVVAALAFTAVTDPYKPAQAIPVLLFGLGIGLASLIPEQRP
jgi:energy-coupling factor transporter transmembrane protein EcfT